MNTPEAGPHSSSAAQGRARRIGPVALLAIAGWVIVGIVRGPSLAASAFAASESPRTVSIVETTTIPPFIFQVRGTVTEPGGASYTSVQFFLIEPVTGWWINLSGLGVAPSAYDPPSAARG